jgi:hypothetical protein
MASRPSSSLSAITRTPLHISETSWDRSKTVSLVINSYVLIIEPVSSQ